MPSKKQLDALAAGRVQRRGPAFDAKVRGDKRYFGKPCPNGHSGERFTSSRGCTICASARTNAVRKANPAPSRENARRWARANPERIRARRHANPALYYAIKVKARAAKLLRTVEWADDEQIKAYYKIASRLTRAVGRRYEVDHIFPLQGKLVSGLHVQNNLQILLKSDNCRKGAGFKGDLSEV